MRRLDVFIATFQLEAFLFGQTHPEAAGFHEDQVREAFDRRGFAQDGQQDAGPIFLHLHGQQKGVQRAGGQQAVHHGAGNLRGKIVDVRLDLRDGVRLVGTTCRRLRLCRSRRVFNDFTEHRAQGVGPVFQLPAAKAVADLVDLHRGHRAETLPELRRDGGTRGGDEFKGLVNLAHLRNHAQDFQGRRRWNRKPPVGTIHPPSAVRQRTDENLLHAEFLHPDAGADDVRDGIQRADFVEGDGFDRRTMDLCFGQGDAVKDAQCVFAHKLREVAGLDERADLLVGTATVERVGVNVFVERLAGSGTMVMVVVGMSVIVVMLVTVGMRMGILVSMIMFMRMPVIVPMCMSVIVVMLVAVGMFVVVPIVLDVNLAVFVCFLVLVVRVHRAAVDAELDSFEVLPFPALEVHVEISDVQLRKLPFEGGWLDAQVTQRTDSHVAADTGKTIEKEYTHGKGRRR